MYTSGTPYLNWTAPTDPKLPALMRGKSGEDLEAGMVMSNIETGEVYSFAADAYGQVLVPSEAYSLVETAHGVEQYFSMLSTETTLVEVGLAPPAANQDIQGAPDEVQTFPTGALYCDGVSCIPALGVTIS